MGAKSVRSAVFIGEVTAAADFLAPGAIEVNRYQAEIFDLVRRRFVFGQRINQTPATGQPSRYFEQVAIPVAGFTDPRVITPTASQPSRVERPVTLKAIIAQINYSLFDVEVNQQQGQFAYLEAKDLTDAVDSTLKLHDVALWNGSDTDLVLPTTNQYFGVSGQIASAPTIGPESVASTFTMLASDSLVDKTKTAVAEMVGRTDFEVRPSAIYMNPLLADLFDQEAKTVQLYFNEVEVIPGVIVKALPTQAGVLPLIPDAGLPTLPGSAPGKRQYSEVIVSEEYIEYHWLTSPVPRVFQLGLVGNLAGQFVIVKFGSVVAKGASYAHRIGVTER